MGIALFSGAVGTIAVCKEVKGVATSIPGVAIAVALMPPLCAIGFGLGIAVTGNSTDGLQIARGAGLLILTNLVAITFTAMLVFLALNIGTESVTKQVREWRGADDESRWAKYLIARFPGFDKLRTIGSLPGRFLLILVPIALISVPLYESFSQLQSEIVRKQKENRVQTAAENLWKENFARLPDGRPRGYLNSVGTSVKDDKIFVQINLLTSQPLSKDDRSNYMQMLTSKLGMSAENLDVQFVEIPTTSRELLTKTQEQKRQEIRSEADKVFSEKQAALAAQMREHSLSGINEYFKNLKLPAPAELVNYEININGGGVPNVKIIYLSSQEIAGNEQISIADEIQARLDDPAAKVSFARIEPLAGTISFEDKTAKLSDVALAQLDLTGQILQQYPNLSVEISTGKSENPAASVSNERTKLIGGYLASKWQIAPNRIVFKSVSDSKNEAILQIEISENNQ